MSSATAAPPDCGEQEPRVLWVPPYVSTSGEEAIQLCEMAGLWLDDWQARALVDSLGERADGLWSARDVGVMVSRQNGKGSLLVARELVGMYLAGEKLIVHSAHQFDTSLEAFRRLLDYVDGSPELSRRVRKVSHAHGEEGIELIGGQRIRFRTRTKGGGRGFSADCVILDEAMVISEAMHAALLPTLSARPNPQVWYTGSAVDQQEMEHGVVFARIRERGLAGNDPSLAYFEWSAAGSLADLKRRPDLANDTEAWARANPALGIRITTETIAAERRSMSTRKFAVERLGIGDWPSTEELEPKVINLTDWELCGDDESMIDGQPVFAVDVNPERTSGTIAVAGLRADGMPHVEVVDHGDGVGWLVGACAKLQVSYKKSSFVVQARGPAAALITDMEAAKLTVVAASAADYSSACGGFYDAVIEHRLRYIPPQPEIESALDGVKTRATGESWTWSRKDSTVDISPLVAVTLALWGVQNIKAKPTPALHDPNEVAARMVAEGRACGNCLRRLNGADVCPECGWRRDSAR